MSTECFLLSVMVIEQNVLCIYLILKDNEGICYCYAILYIVPLLKTGAMKSINQAYIKKKKKKKVGRKETPPLQEVTREEKQFLKGLK